MKSEFCYKRCKFLKDDAPFLCGSGGDCTHSQDRKLPHSKIQIRGGSGWIDATVEGIDGNGFLYVRTATGLSQVKDGGPLIKH